MLSCIPPLKNNRIESKTNRKRKEKKTCNFAQIFQMKIHLTIRLTLGVHCLCVWSAFGRRKNNKIIHPFDWIQITITYAFQFAFVFTVQATIVYTMVKCWVLNMTFSTRKTQLLFNWKIFSLKMLPLKKWIKIFLWNLLFINSSIQKWICICSLRS